MSVYIINFLFNMLFGGFLLSPNDDDSKSSDRRKRFYLFVTFLQFGLLCGFRASTVGWDTDNYIYIFNLTPDNWNTIFENNLYIEIGFSVFCSVIKILGGSHQTMLIISSLFVMASACIFVYRHSQNILLSVFILISFPFYYSSFDIIRHFMATSFFLLGYKYIVEKKPIKYLIFIYIGSLFHTFSWVFLFFYFLRYIKWNVITLFFATVGTLLSYFYIEPIAIWLSEKIGKGDGIESGWIGDYGGGIKTAIMYLIIFMICIVAYNCIEKISTNEMNAINLVLVLLIFSILFINARMMTRLIMTSVPLMSIAIPELVNRKKITESSIYYLLLIAFIGIGIIYHSFMLINSWQSVVPYVPYWK